MLVYWTIWNILTPCGWYILWPFCLLCLHLESFSRFGMFGPKETLAWAQTSRLLKNFPLEPTLRLLNFQQQRQRCSTVERFYI
jgi:hypothetical protein